MARHHIDWKDWKRGRDPRVRHRPETENRDGYGIETKSSHARPLRKGAPTLYLLVGFLMVFVEFLVVVKVLGEKGPKTPVTSRRHFLTSAQRGFTIIGESEN